MASVFSFECAPLPGETRVVGFLGEESVSTLYRFELWLAVPDADADAVDLDALIGLRGTLRARRGRGAPPGHPRRRGRGRVGRGLAPARDARAEALARHARPAQQGVRRQVVPRGARRDAAGRGARARRGLRAPPRPAVPPDPPCVPVPREPLRFRPALDGADGGVLLVRTRRRAREAGGLRREGAPPARRGQHRPLLRLGRGRPLGARRALDLHPAGGRRHRDLARAGLQLPDADARPRPRRARRRRRPRGGRVAHRGRRHQPLRGRPRRAPSGRGARRCARAVPRAGAGVHAGLGAPLRTRGAPAGLPQPGVPLRRAPAPRQRPRRGGREPRAPRSSGPTCTASRSSRSARPRSTATPA